MTQINRTFFNPLSNFETKESLNKTSFEKQEYDEFHFRKRYVNAVQQVAIGMSQSTLTDNKYFKFNFSESDFNLKHMNDWYSDQKITYFTKHGLEDLQVYIINGLFYNKDLSLYNSTVNLDAASGDGEMVVMDRLGNTFIAPKQRGIVHHSSFFSGKPVAFAALCFIRDGKIQNLIRYSGHYSLGETEENSFSRQLNTIYLVEEKAFAALKIDKKGSLVQTIAMSSKQKVKELYDKISEIGEFLRPKLRLISDGKEIPETKLIDNAYVDITIGEATSNLKSGHIITALEFTYKPRYRILPVNKFELIIQDQND